MGQGQTGKRWTAARARDVLAAAKESGESLKSYAERQGIDPQRLYSWRRKLEGGEVKGQIASKEGFVRVQVAGSAAAKAASVFELELGAGRVVRVSGDFDAVVLRRLVATLEEVGR